MSLSADRPHAGPAHAAPAIPVVDMSELSSADFERRAAVAAEVGTACRGIGFFAVVGHGVSESLTKGVFAAAHDFFHLPADAKDALAISRHGHNRGYVGLGVETLNHAAAADRKEAFNLIWTEESTRPPNLWPDLPRWREPVQSYFDAALAVGRRLHRAFAIDLGIQEDFFTDKLDAPLATLRLLRYPGRTDTSDPQSGAGAHTDYGNVTLLATDEVAGLQVRRRQGGEWIEVPAIPGALICNIGDCLMRWTNDMYVSTPHRVSTPSRERYSVAFFLDANPDAEVRSLANCVGPSRPERYAPILVAQYLQQRFDAAYAVATGPENDG